MKLEIYEPEKVEKEEPVKLKFKQEPNGDITIEVVNKYGERVLQGDLITFQNNGTIYRHGDISKNFGFRLDDNGRIELENN